MKKESPLWSSISLLIGIVIAILALIRGRMLLPLLLAEPSLFCAVGTVVAPERKSLRQEPP